MGKRVNKYGLTDVIPPDVKRIVRQRDGFGCVKCGCAIVQYEHIEPEFAEAKSHDPAGITLLCTGCHGKKTQKWRSPAWVKDGMRDPICIRKGYSHDELDPGTTPPVIHIGGNIIHNCSVPLSVNGYPIISVEEPEAPGGPYRLSANFYNEKSKPMLTIERNEWRVHSGQWDVEASAGQIIVRSANRKYSLDIRFIPREGIRIEQIHMQFGDYLFRATSKSFVIWSKGVLIAQIKNAGMMHSPGGLALSSPTFHPGRSQ